MNKLIAFLAVLFSALQICAQDAAYHVGIARVDITPDYPIRLNGFGVRRTESEGVTQHIWAKALAIRHGDELPALLVTLDSLGIRESMVNEVASRVQKATGISRDRIVVAFSHSHTTPKVNGASDTIFSTPIPPEHQEHIDRYTQELTDAIEKVCLDAVKDLQPASLAWSVGKVGFAINRRTAGGPVDHDLPVLFVKSPEGKIRAVYVTYACHCVTLSDNKISGDWAGFAQELIERKFPGALGLVSIGCGSDSNPSSGVVGDRVDIATEQGAQIADEVERLSKEPLRPIEGPVTARLEYLDLPLHNVPTEEQLRELAKQDNATGYNARFQLEKIARGEQLQTALHYPIQTFSFGDRLHMVFLAGEVCVDYSLRLKKELNRELLWMHGYANDFCAYIPSERLLKEGGYGGGGEIVYFALPATLEAGLEEKIVSKIKEMTPPAFQLAKGTQGVPPLSPEEALGSFRLDSRFEMDIAASEPLLSDPVAIDFGPDGRLWVAEMPDYSREVDEQFEPRGTVKFLEDKDQDGRYDHATVFLDNLRFPTGVTVWRDGVLVCDAPLILYAEDANKDGKADVRVKMYGGFATHNPHARVNSLSYGLDGWVYGSGALFGGEIKSFSNATVTLQRSDFRIQPDAGTIEPVTGVTQQGRARDDWDNWFGCDNGTLAFHYPVYDQYVRRNPSVAPPSPHISVAVDEAASRLIPAGDLVMFKLSGAPGRATSACGLEVYRDELLGREFRGNSFTCEPVHQVVHRLVLERQGAVFRGHRAAEELDREFLASTDRWFRPVQVRTGPDGALWIVDMYRYVIEHKRWIPPESLAELDVFAGETRGRIYRIYPKDQPRRDVPKFSELQIPELTALLDHPNGVVRDMAQQQLLWRDVNDITGRLDEIVRHGQYPEGRMQALCILGVQKQMKFGILQTALNDPHSGVRRHAVRLSEERMDRSEQLLAAVLEKVTDPAYEVRYQLAYSLGACDSPDAAKALAKLAREHSDDVYMVAAVTSSLNGQNIGTALNELAGTLDESQAELFGSFLALAVDLGDADPIRKALDSITGSEPTAAAWRFNALRQVLEASDRLEHGQQHTEDARWQAWFELASEIATDADASEQLRVSAIRLLGMNRETASVQSLAALIAPQQAAGVQLAAIESLGRIADPAAASALIDGLDAASPAVRSSILDSLLSRDAWATGLLDAIEDNRVALNHFDAARRQILLDNSNEQVRSRAAQVFSASQSSRQEVVDSYMQSLVAGDPTRGNAVFTKHCSNCHKLGDTGHAVGPDLAALINKSPSSLVVSILDPNRNVEDRYQSYIAVLEDGRTATGLMASETSASVTLQEQEGKTHVLLRRDLEILRNTGKSLMPEGLEKDLSPDQLSDAIAFLMQLGPPPKTMDGNQPSVVSADNEGTLTLLAANAEIYGGHIVFEQLFQNIGLWYAEQDRASWRVDVPRAGQYDVQIEFACAEDSAGNKFRLDGGTPVISGQVQSTGGWDKYRLVKIGTVELEGGLQYITLRPDGPLLRGALLDLRKVILSPSE